jgi:hypothetical protein
VFNRGHYRFAVAGFPIRTSSDQSLYTAPRGLSQCPTSFIGTWRQGILRKLLVASPRDAEKLILFCFGLHHQITIQLLRYCSPLTGDRCSQLTSRASVALQTIFLSETIRPGNTAGSFKNPYWRFNLDFMPAYRSTTFVSLQSFSTNSVEMTGFEPVTFALQRRCSPAELHPQSYRVWA